VVTLTDQFGSRTAKIVRPDALCVPVDKDGEGLRNPGSDLTCYKAVPRRSPSLPEVAVGNEFGPDRLAVKGPRTLCVPSGAPGS
jgi:hypothetical protein